MERGFRVSGGFGVDRHWTIEGAGKMKAPPNGAFAGDGAELNGPQELWPQELWERELWAPRYLWSQEPRRVGPAQALPT